MTWLNTLMSYVKGVQIAARIRLSRCRESSLIYNEFEMNINTSVAVKGSAVYEFASRCTCFDRLFNTLDIHREAKHPHNLFSDNFNKYGPSNHYSFTAAFRDELQEKLELKYFAYSKISCRTTQSNLQKLNVRISQNKMTVTMAYHFNTFLNPIQHYIDKSLSKSPCNHSVYQTEEINAFKGLRYVQGPQSSLLADSNVRLI